MHFRNRTRVLPPRVFDPPLPIRKIGSAIESSGYRRLITEKRIGSINDSCLPLRPRDIVVGGEERPRKNDREMEFIYLFILFSRAKRKKERKKNRES